VASALDPQRVIASFDSASVLHAATVAALSGRPFPALGNPAAVAWLARVGGRLPWPILRQIYTRIGGAEGIDPRLLGRVDLEAVAASFADAYRSAPPRQWPAVLIGASNGALTHLAAAMQTPWLPSTVLIPVSRRGDPNRPDEAMKFGRQVATPLLEANQTIALHQMHDAAQDELMTSRMTYFRTKWLNLPDAYAAFLDRALAPDAPVIMIDDRTEWPVADLGARHMFQNGGLGGLTPEQYRQRPHATPLDKTAPEAEWGVHPSLVDAVREWAASRGRRFVRLVLSDPQAAAAPVAETIRDWYRRLDRTTDELIVPSFILGDPWRTLQIGRVPYWTFFAVRPALDALADYLDSAEPYRSALALMFQHGVRSPGAVLPDDMRAVFADRGVAVRFVALDEDKAPHDIRTLAAYGADLAREPDRQAGWSPLPVDQAIQSLAAHGLEIE